MIEQNRSKNCSPNKTGTSKIKKKKNMRKTVPFLWPIANVRNYFSILLSSTYFVSSFCQDNETTFRKKLQVKQRQTTEKTNCMVVNAR